MIGMDVVVRNLDEFNAEMRRRAARTMDIIGHHLANDAKTNHPWTPRTGATDVSTIGGLVAETQEYVKAAFQAGMTYNVFLELAREGRWAWLWPTVERNQAWIENALIQGMSL